MKIYIMTDLEGCAGVMNAPDYIYGNSRYYEHACELATLETSAAVEGALEAGATEVVVVDGHGPGAMKRQWLHPRALLLGGRPWPREQVAFGCDGSYTAAMIIGQHAMSGTDGGHLSHTMSFAVEEYRLNDMPVGELGMIALFTGYFGVPLVMVSGDQAACDEARALVPDIETATVKTGLKRGSSHGMTADENSAFNAVALHQHPDEARRRIRDHAFRAVRRIPEIAPYRIEGPYRMDVTTRATQEKPATKFTVKAGDMLDLIRQLWAGPKTASAKAAKPPAPAKIAPKAAVKPAVPAKPAPAKSLAKPSPAPRPVAPKSAKPTPAKAKPVTKAAPKPAPGKRPAKTAKKR